ncbi:MAG: hypothetical protein U0905_01805 [Pirellulales bacterium]
MKESICIIEIETHGGHRFIHDELLPAALAHTTAQRLAEQVYTAIRRIRLYKLEAAAWESEDLDMSPQLAEIMRENLIENARDEVCDAIKSVRSLGLPGTAPLSPITEYRSQGGMHEPKPGAKVPKLRVSRSSSMGNAKTKRKNRSSASVS